MQEELISIVMPLYNSEKFILNTLHSIASQTYKKWELIIVDDASNDKSSDIVERFIEEWTGEQTIQLIKQEINGGPAKARNKGIKAAGGRYLTYQDADDLWKPDKLERQVCFMQKKQCAFSFTGYEFADEFGNLLNKRVFVPKELTYAQALKNTTISTITVMFDRTKISGELLLMPENCKREDTATWWKILRAGYTAYGINEILSVYCRHKDSHSANKLQAVAGTYRMYRSQEGLGILKTWYYMLCYIYNAIRRRI